MRFKLALALLLCSPATLCAQGGFVRDYVLSTQTSTVNGVPITYAQPVSGAQIRVCTGSGTPCTPLASIYTDSALMSAKANPFGTDTNGNFTFYALPGFYYVDITANGTTTQFLYAVNNTTGSAISATSVTVSGAVTAASAAITTVTATSLTAATLSLTGQFTSTLATGTAPFVVASTTQVANLTLQNHPKVLYCGTTTTCGNTAEVSARILVGSAPLDNASPSKFTVTGISPAFTSTATYTCWTYNTAQHLNDQPEFTPVSSSSFTFTTNQNTLTDVMRYGCIGF